MLSSEKIIYDRTFVSEKGQYNVLRDIYEQVSAKLDPRGKLDSYNKRYIIRVVVEEADYCQLPDDMDEGGA